MDIEALLKRLRDEPAANEDVSGDVLASVYEHLMADSVSGSQHWFCDKAEPLKKEAASFLLRLFAYTSDKVVKWKERIEHMLSRCVGCVKGFAEVKSTSRRTYFGAFPDEVMANFYSCFIEWEIEMILKHLHSQTGASVGRALSWPKDLPMAVAYHILSEPATLKNAQILSLFHSKLPTEVFNWPADPPPPGLFLLMLDEHDQTRKWARSQISKCQAFPIAFKYFTKPYMTVLHDIYGLLSRTSEKGIPSIPITHNAPSNGGSVSLANAQFQFTTRPVVLWSSFLSILRFIPPECLTPGNHHKSDIRRIVSGHLHDVGPHVVDVLRCLRLLLIRLGAKFWQGEELGYPQIIFDAIKDNTTYTDLLKAPDAGERSWLVTWFSGFLNTLQHHPNYGQILAKSVDFMCEELQHERFHDIRPFVMSTVTQLLSAILRNKDMSGILDDVVNVVDIHAHIFISVAFARTYNDPTWKDARCSARDLIACTLLMDVDDICNSLSGLCTSRDNIKASVKRPKMQKHLWKETYRCLQPTDSDGIALIVATIAKIAHIDALTKNAFVQTSDQANSAVTETAFNYVNQSLATVRAGFLDAMSRYAYHGNSSHVLELMRNQNAVKDIMILMLSPVEDFHIAAQILVSQAFDVDVRLDCFRALLENLPSAAFKGMFEFLETFIRFAPTVPEACSLSKSLVRCLTDVIEALCASHDGLLRSNRFVTMNVEWGLATVLSKWWTLMTGVIAMIFQKTPDWSTFFEHEDMTVWLRDALIFGRELLAQRRVIESAQVLGTGLSTSLRDTKERTPSRVGRNMVNDLQIVLPELTRWLRLTDEELLHQSFTLLKSLLDCFRENGIVPSEAGLTKINKHVSNARKKGRESTRLDSASLLALESALASFIDDDDEVEILYVKPAAIPSMAVSGNQTPLVTGSTLSKTAKAPTTQEPGKPSTTSATSTKGGILKAGKPADKPKDLPTKHTPYSATIGDNGSSQSDSGSEDEPQGGLAALASLQRTPKIKRQTQRRQIKMIDVPSLGSKLKQDRLSRQKDVKRTALRMKPDISNLHRMLLSWNYDHEGPNPPFSDRPTLLHVPDRFSDHQHYRRVFEPLLHMECWSQILQSKDEPQECFMATISSRQFVDDWLDLDVLISEDTRKDWYLTDSDIVLFRHPNNNKSTLGKVQTFKATQLGTQATIRFYFRVGSSDPGLDINSAWRLSKVFSLTTIHREYAALMALPYYDFAETVFQPRLSEKPVLDERDVKQAMVNYGINKPQAAAIMSALGSTGFVLIQGPPGTGKTLTICGLLRAFLSKRPRASVTIHAGRDSTNADKVRSQKILLCAPSNAAIDELCDRVRRTGQGATGPKVVRIGTEQGISLNVKDISLDHLVEQRLGSRPDSATPLKDVGNEIRELREQIGHVRKQKQTKEAELSQVHDNTARTLALGDEIKRLNSQRLALTKKFDRLKDKQKSDSRTLDATRRKLRAEILHEADIVCSTLSGAAHELLEQFEFEMVVIDEAAQAIELSSLIPLKYQCKSCIMVGDPQQLPPTVLSQEACKYQYNQSLFLRLQKYQPDAVHLLSIQYRMHPEISKLPSLLFYAGNLLDGPGMETKTKRPWQEHIKFGPYKFFNVRGNEESGLHHSLKNKAECNIAVALYSRLRKEFASLIFKIGIVSMYSAQVRELRHSFEQRFGRDIKNEVSFSTVDGFQGQEKDIIVLSCVRAGSLQKIGFLADTRRMNVAITRAKSSLFILGNASTLERCDEHWRAIIHDARSRALLCDVDVTYFTTPTASLNQSKVGSKPKKGISQTTHSLDTSGGTVTASSSTKHSTLGPGTKDVVTASVTKAQVSTAMHVFSFVSQLKLTRSNRTSIPGTGSLPPDLATPAALKDALNQSISHMSAGSSRQEQPLLTNTSQKILGTVGQKRPISVDDTSVSNNPNPKPRPPPAKRPKPPASIFIPKPPKRPAPNTNK